MTNDDLLLLANSAKAVGYTGVIRAVVSGLKYDMPVDDEGLEWNPLENSDQALYLMATLPLDVEHLDKGMVVTGHSEETYAFGVVWGVASMRRAITKAAAILGENK